MGSALLGGMISGVPCADMELLALSADLISSYFVRGCMEVCMRGCIIRYFPPPHGRRPAAADADGVAGHGRVRRAAANAGPNCAT